MCTLNPFKGALYPRFQHIKVTKDVPLRIPTPAMRKGKVPVISISNPTLALKKKKKSWRY